MEEMQDFHSLVQVALVEYARQPGLIGIEVDGHPALGLRYKFSDVSLAARFMALREFHNSFKHSESNILGIDGSDVVEMWGV
jgi:hypothetical protein